MPKKQKIPKNDPHFVGKVTELPNWVVNLFIGCSPQSNSGVGYKSPRSTDEYKGLGVSDISRRILKDMDELVARICPPPTLRKNAVSVLDEVITDEDQMTGAFEKERENAATQVVFITRRAATLIENLYVNCPDLIKTIAIKQELWPVNLGLKPKRKKGTLKNQLTRSAFARKYLEGLELNSCCDHNSGSGSRAEAPSPYRLFAERLHEKILFLTTKPEWFPPDTVWAKRVFALPVPMTKKNAPKWWKVVKVLLDERWETAPNDFTPLIKHLRLKQSSKTPYPSNIKSRVIDGDLQSAFRSLARHDS